MNDERASRGNTMRGEESLNFWYSLRLLLYDGLFPLLSSFFR